MTATMADVARRAGVSTATVSRVLSGAAPATEATRGRVLAAVQELDYRPSGIGRALKARATGTIGLLVTDIGNPFFPQVVRSVEDAAIRRGYRVVLGNASDDPDRELAYLDLLLDGRVDGLIVASSHATRRHAERLRDVGRPVVLLNAPSPELGIGGMSTDHRAGARLAATHLLELGHRALAHVGAAPDVAAAAGPRRAGVEDAVADAGLDPAGILAVVGEPTVAGGAAAMAELLGAGERPTAIVCYNDLMAIGALRTLRLAGLAVPRDVSVVGFDDIDLAAWTDPALTTVAQPTAELGHLAVERLATWSVGGSANGEWQLLTPRLVVRETTSAHGSRQGTA